MLKVILPVDASNEKPGGFDWPARAPDEKFGVPKVSVEPASGSETGMVYVAAVAFTGILITAGKEETGLLPGLAVFKITYTSQRPSALLRSVLILLPDVHLIVVRDDVLLSVTFAVPLPLIHCPDGSVTNDIGTLTEPVLPPEILNVPVEVKPDHAVLTLSLYVTVVVVSESLVAVIKPKRKCAA